MLQNIEDNIAEIQNLEQETQLHDSLFDETFENNLEVTLYDDLDEANADCAEASMISTQTNFSIINGIRSKYKKATAERNQELFLALREKEKELTESTLSDMEKTQIEEEIHHIKESIVCENIGLTIAFARRVSGKDDDLFSDYVSQGVLGLLRAIKDFDVTRGISFSTYAIPWVRQSVGRYFMDTVSTIRLPVHVRETMYRMQLLRDQLKNTGNFRLANDEKYIAKKLNIPVHSALLYLMLLDSGNQCFSFDQPVPDGEGDNSKTYSDVIADSFQLEKETLNNYFNKIVLDSVMQALNPREKKIIRLRFGFEDGRIYTLQEIADNMHVTRERIRQIENTALKKLAIRAKKEHISREDVFVE